MSENLKHQIIDAAKLLACTPESEATGTPDVMRHKIHALIEACENLIRDNAEIIEWVKVADEMPIAFVGILLFGKMSESDSHARIRNGYYDDDGGGLMTEDGKELRAITHWAELPKGPEI